MGLSWTKPASDGGTKLTGYVVEKKKKGGDWEECASVPPHALTATISNLPEGEEFQFRVRGENACGLGEPSKPTKDIKIEDQPGKCVLGITVTVNVAGPPHWLSSFWFDFSSYDNLKL